MSDRVKHIGSLPALKDSQSKLLAAPSSAALLREAISLMRPGTSP